MSTAPARLLLSLLPLVAFEISLGPASRDAHAGAGPPAPVRRYISAAGEDVLMELWNQGKLRDHPLAREVAARRAAEREANETLDERAARPLLPWPGLATQALGKDAIANDRSLSSCLCANGLPVTESEPSGAAVGPYVVASWNDQRGACIGQPGTKQGFAWSSDYGATFHEGELLSDSVGVRFRGDPTVAVNAKTGAFYVSGLSSGTGVSIVRGHFTESGFVIDLRRNLPSLPNDFHDKPWMAVDSTTGRVYVTYTNFGADNSSRIELRRLDADLNPLGPTQQLAYTPPDVIYGCQVSFPAVGPDGVLYVAWEIYYINHLDFFNNPPSHYEVVRSDDFGETFGPVQTLADHFWNIQATPPGSLRGIWAGVIALAVDMSQGPYRGRVYATWTEIPDTRGAAPGGAIVNEVENNGFFASATPFTPGNLLRGSLESTGFDFFKFTGQRGQVFAIKVDTLNANPRSFRALCPADTASVATYDNLCSGLQMVFGLPYDGTYYLRLESQGGVGTYQFSTMLVPPSAESRSRDIRDQFLSWSDDGATWSTPVRLNDDPPGSDGAHVEVAVDGRGRVHCFWFDWRDDAACGVISEQYTTSSGDGGVTWGANRKMTDASSFWGMRASCSNGNYAEYNQMAATGDWVYSVFSDSRLGDPDVFVDASRFTSVSTCPDDLMRAPGSTATLDFSLVNQGNFDTPLAWRVSDSAGWLTGATPAAQGSQTLAANGGTQIVQATFLLSDTCEPESTVVRFVTSDPYIPGFEDTCVTILKCDVSTPVQVSLVGSSVRNGTVTLRWHGVESAGVTARISRRAAAGDWVDLGPITADAAGVFRFEDRQVPAGRYVYRFAIEGGADDDFLLETPVEVPALAFALLGAWADRSGPGLQVSIQLASPERARLELVDVAGRVVAWREVVGAGSHQVRLGGQKLPSGVYLVRLRQGESVAITKAVVLS
jgi:hypothetical protein